MGTTRFAQKRGARWIGALFVPIVIGGLACGSDGTRSIDCYDMRNTTVITDLADTERNDYNWDRCQQPGQENTVLEWDMAE